MNNVGHDSGDNREAGDSDPFAGMTEGASRCIFSERWGGFSGISKTFTLPLSETVLNAYGRSYTVNATWGTGAGCTRLLFSCLRITRGMLV